MLCNLKVFMKKSQISDTLDMNDKAGHRPEGGNAMGMVLDFPGKNDGDTAWEIRALKNGAAQAAEAWQKVHETNGGLTEMIDLWRGLADVADEFGAKLADIALRLETMGASARSAQGTDAPEG